MSKDAKFLRSQIRNVFNETYPELLTDALVEAVYKRVSETLNDRLNAIESHLKSTLTDIDNRSKDVQSFVLRNSTRIEK